MTFDEMILRPVLPVIAAWLARLADRVADLREQARLGVIEAVDRTTAEAVEGSCTRPSARSGRWR